MSTTDNMGVERTSRTSHASIDWITMTKKLGEDELSHLLLSLGNKDGWEDKRRQSMYGYKHCVSNGGISVLYGGNDGQVTVELTGSGCRETAEYLNFQSQSDWQDWINARLENNWQFSRMDYAFDDIARHLTMSDLVNRVRDEHLTTSARRRRVLMEFSSKAKRELPTVYIGSSSSEKLLRMYDKDGQRGLQSEMVRIEMQVRKRTAQEWAKLFSDAGFAAIAPLIAGFVSFKVPHPTDTNRSRWADWKPWKKAMGEAARFTVKARPIEHHRVIDQRADWYLRTHSRRLAEIVAHPRYGRQWLEWMLIVGRTERGVSLPGWSASE